MVFLKTTANWKTDGAGLEQDWASIRKQMVLDLNKIRQLTNGELFNIEFELNECGHLI